MAKSKERVHYETLQAEIRRHEQLYHVLDRPEISDLDFDKLYAELLKIEESHPDWITPASPSQRVSGEPLPAFVKAPHRTPMLSLANTYSPEDLRDFDEKTHKFLIRENSVALEYFAEPKFDGLALELIYEKGLLVRALTRGDGAVGEDVTHNVRTIRSIPLQLDTKTPPDLLEVRGEALMLKADFAELNEKQQELGQATFANPRNASAGTIRQLDPKIAASRPLRFFAYALGVIEGDRPLTQADLEESFHRWGLPVVEPRWRRLCNGIEEVISYYHELESARSTLPFDIDGMVVKINSFKEQEDLGFVARTPRWASAAKYKPAQAETVVENIVIQVGRTGALTPVAQLHPVRVGGVTITNATLHNQEELSRKDIRIGDTVLVQRAGDVIPEVVSVVLDKRKKSSKPFLIPLTCPVCESRAEQLEGEVVLRCSNPQCPAVMKELLVHFVARRAMNLDKVGEKLVQALYEKNLVKKFSDFYRLTAEDIQTLERQGEKSTQNILESIERSKKTTLARLIFAFGIRFVGEQTARSLAEHFGTAENFLEATEESLLQVPDIGPQVAKSILHWLANPQSRKEVLALLKLGVSPEKIKRQTTGPLVGKSFVITGTLPVKRDDAKDWIQKNGGQILSSVSSKLNYLVAGEDPGSKLEKAQSLGVTVIDWAQLQDLVLTGDR